MMTVSGAVLPSPRPFAGSLLVAVTTKAARPDGPALAVTVATWTNLWFGGQSVQAPAAGRPEIVGGVMSILIRTEADADKPAPLMAEQVKVVPSVSVESVVVPQPLEEDMPDSGSTTFQLTVTGLPYQLLLPKVPAMLGVMTGGVVSLACSKSPG